MLSFGIFSFLPARMAVRRRGFELGSPPPMRAAIVISRMTRVNTRPRFASVAAFLCLMVAHFECPDMTLPLFYFGTGLCRRLDAGDPDLAGETPLKSGPRRPTQGAPATRSHDAESPVNRKPLRELRKFNTAGEREKRGYTFPRGFLLHHKQLSARSRMVFNRLELQLV